ncbi:MAG: hypothetical protein WCV81_04840 [Microgenomates group bacterium]|jgi:hypothetical protein
MIEDQELWKNAGEDSPPRPWPTIVLPEERREQLTAKLTEYRGRIEKDDRRYQHPDLRLILEDDTTSKIIILERLLRDGQINTRELMGELQDRLGDSYNPLTLIQPILVINDYCQTGGTHTAAGTGLPQI